MVGYILENFPTLPLTAEFRSQSRMRGDYLYYEEKIEVTPEEKDAKAARRYAYSYSSTSHSSTVLQGEEDS